MLTRVYARIFDTDSDTDPEMRSLEYLSSYKIRIGMRRSLLEFKL